MVKEDLFMFNPFRIERSTEEEIAQTYTNLQQRIIEEADTPFLIAQNIELYANMSFLLGEVIARIAEQYDLLKTEITIEENQALYSYRNQWQRENDEKAPAMAYFQALAKQVVKDKYEELAHLGAKLTRFKRAFESLEQKQNSLKYKAKAMEFESF